MTAEDLARLHDLTDLLTLAASLSVMGAVGWYLVKMRGRLGGLAGATALMAVFVLALAATRVGQFVITNIPGAEGAFLVEAFASAVTVTVAIAAWPMVPKLLSLPTRCELMEANRRLVAEQEARQALVEQMRNLYEELELRVADRTRELEHQRRRFEIALEGTNIAVAEQDRDLRYTWIYNAPASLGGQDVVGRLPMEVLPASTAAAQAEVKNRVLASGRAERFEVSFPAPGGTCWYEGRVEPLLEAGEVTGVMVVSVDITRHKEHESQIREVLRELTHRSKNLLAVVQGIARQSASGDAAAEAFLPTFNGRLQALARAHEILVEENWGGIGLTALVARERDVDTGSPMPPVEAVLPDRLLTPEAGQNLALALHELFVEARAASGEVALRIDWSETCDRFTLEWERRGPPTGLLVAGFGPLFLERHMPRSVGGTAHLTIEPEATRYRLEGPIGTILAA